MLRFFHHETPTFHKRMTIFTRAMTQNHDKIDITTINKSTNYNTQQGDSYSWHIFRNEKIIHTGNLVNLFLIYDHFANKYGVWINA